MHVVGALLAMLGVWLMRRSLRFVWNLLGLIGWLKPFLDGVKLFYLVLTCCGRCAFDLTACLVGCMLQVCRLCGFEINGLDEDAAVGGVVGGDSVEEIGTGGAARVADKAAGVAGDAAGVAGDAAGVVGKESIEMRRLGVRDRVAKVHGGGGGDRVSDGGKDVDGGSGSISPG